MRTIIKAAFCSFVLHCARFEVMQTKFGRRLIGGKFYYIDASPLRMAPFWSDEPILSCGCKIIKTERWC
jgi:hypothetical protein